MTRYYFSIVKPLVRYFTDLSLSNLVTQLEKGRLSNTNDGAVSIPDSVPFSDTASNSSAGSWRQPYQYGEEVDGLSPEDGITLAQPSPAYLEHNLSASEVTRIVRAIYRVQLWCNLFGYGPGPSLGGLDKSTCADATGEEIACIFFETFEPWEIEEMLCIYEPVRLTFAHLFEDMRTDLLEYDKTHKGEISFFSYGNDERDYDCEYTFDF